MLSDEEKEALDKLSSKKNESTWDDTIRQIKREEIKDVVVTRQKYITAVLKLIEKQSKEIEELNLENIELKQSKIINKNSIPNQDNFYDCYNYISKEESKQKEKQAYIDGTNIADKLCNKKWEDKIKAKLEEVHYKMIAHQDVREAVKQVLQSLLEKE